MKPPPHETPHALAARLTRQEREAAALRENLRRRKQQTRERGAATDLAAREQGGAATLDDGEPTG